MHGAGQRCNRPADGFGDARSGRGHPDNSGLDPSDDLDAHRVPLCACLIQGSGDGFRRCLHGATLDAEDVPITCTR